MKKSNKRAPRIFYLGIFVLCMTLFSSHMTGGLYARYTSNASGSDSARVARFDVAIDFTDGHEFVLSRYEAGKGVLDYVISVASQSEVAVTYDVVLIFSQTPPDWVVVEIDENIPTSIADGAGGTKIYTFTKVGSLGPTTTEQELSHHLTFTMPTLEQMNANTYPDFNDLGVKIVVQATQID